MLYIPSLLCKQEDFETTGKRLTNLTKHYLGDQRNSTGSTVGNATDWLDALGSRVSSRAHQEGSAGHHQVWPNSISPKCKTIFGNFPIFDPEGFWSLSFSHYACQSGQEKTQKSFDFFAFLFMLLFATTAFFITFQKVKGEQTFKGS